MDFAVALLALVVYVAIMLALDSAATRRHSYRIRRDR